MAVDFSLYLVTDSTPEILKNRDLGGIIKAAVEGGQSEAATKSDNR